MEVHGYVLAVPTTFTTLTKRDGAYKSETNCGTRHYEKISIQSAPQVMDSEQTERLIRQLRKAKQSAEDAVAKAESGEHVDIVTLRHYPVLVTRKEACRLLGVEHMTLANNWSKLSDPPPCRKPTDFLAEFRPKGASGVVYEVYELRNWLLRYWRRTPRRVDEFWKRVEASGIIYRGLAIL